MHVWLYMSKDGRLIRRVKGSQLDLTMCVNPDGSMGCGCLDHWVENGSEVKSTLRERVPRPSHNALCHTGFGNGSKNAKYALRSRALFRKTESLVSGVVNAL